MSDLSEAALASIAALISPVQQKYVTEIKAEIVHVNARLDAVESGEALQADRLSKLERRLDSSYSASCAAIETKIQELLDKKFPDTTSDGGTSTSTRATSKIPAAFSLDADDGDDGRKVLTGKFANGWQDARRMAIESDLATALPVLYKYTFKVQVSQKEGATAVIMFGSKDIAIRASAHLRNRKLVFRGSELRYFRLKPSEEQILGAASKPLYDLMEQGKANGRVVFVADVNETPEPLLKVSVALSDHSVTAPQFLLGDSRFPLITDLPAATAACSAAVSVGEGKRDALRKNQGFRKA